MATITMDLITITGRLIKKDEIKRKKEEEEREMRRLKRKPNTPHLIKKYTPVPMDKSGKPVMPIQLRGLTIQNLGTIVWDRPKFHAKRYIWPNGFKSSRIYSSMTELDKKYIILYYFYFIFLKLFLFCFYF